MDGPAGDGPPGGVGTGRQGRDARHHRPAVTSRGPRGTAHHHDNRRRDLTATLDNPQTTEGVRPTKASVAIRNPSCSRQMAQVVQPRSEVRPHRRSPGLSHWRPILTTCCGGTRLLEFGMPEMSNRDWVTHGLDLLAGVSNPSLTVTCDQSAMGSTGPKSSLANSPSTRARSRSTASTTRRSSCRCSASAGNGSSPTDSTMCTASKLTARPTNYVNGATSGHTSAR